MAEVENQPKELTINEIWQRAEITGAPQIARSSGLNRWFKIGLFVFCLLGFAYQTSEFIDIYLQYPAILQVKQEKPDSIPLPGVTLCFGHSLNRQKYCADFPEHCINGTMIVKPEYQDIEDHATKEMFEKYGIRYPEIDHYNVIKYKQENFIKMEEVTRVVLLDSKSKRTQCFLINSKVLNPHGKMEVLHTKNRRIEATHENTVDIVIFNDPRLHVRDVVKSPFIVFHSPFSLANPYVDGMLLYNGEVNILPYSMNVVERLPAPYETDCVDYLGRWDNITYKATSREMCIQECIANKALSRCGCFPIGTLWINDVEFCENKHTDCLVQVDVEDCYTECKLDCRSMNFEYKLARREIARTLSIYLTLINVADMEALDIGNYSKVEENVSVGLLLDNVYVRYYIYSPKYETVELFMYVGGYLGIWMGISIIEMVDLVEVTTRVVLILWTRRNKK